MTASLRPLAGHHFGAWLSCPEKAYLAFHGDRDARAPDPPHLIALQNEGNAHEREMCDRHFAGAVVIPDKAGPAERTRQTLDAMRSGAPVILQGYLGDTDEMGIADVLELVRPDAASGTGYVYRVGEIKRSLTLKTAHVMQAAWYTELLGRVQGAALDDALFVLGDGERQLVDLRPVAPAYRATRDALRAMRHGGQSPGPALCAACPSCPWRRVCMPRLIADRDVSLVPGIGPVRRAALRERGVASWPALAEASDEVLAGIGMAPHEVRLARHAVDRLRDGQPVLKQGLRLRSIEEIVPAAVEFEDLVESRRAGLQAQPRAIWFAPGGEIVTRPVEVDDEGAMRVDLAGMGDARRIGLYGGTDRAALRRILRTTDGGRKVPIIDVLSLVERFVHAPVPGLGLDVLAGYAAGLSEPMDVRSAPDRVRAVALVLRWLAQREGQAA